jgi:hypothetical protein
MNNQPGRILKRDEIMEEGDYSEVTGNRIAIPERWRGHQAGDLLYSIYRPSPPPRVEEKCTPIDHLVGGSEIEEEGDILRPIHGKREVVRRLVAYEAAEKEG